MDKDGDGFDYPLTCNYTPIAARSAPSNIDALIEQRIREFVEHLSQTELDYDCYHAQDCISANALAALKQHQQIPHFVRTVHHIEEYISPYLQQCQERSIRAATLCLTVSQMWRQQLQQQYQIDAPRVTNGINLCRFSAIASGLESTLRQRWKLAGSPIYLTVGGIEPRKNSISLLQAFAQVRPIYPQAQLVIAGGATLFDYQFYRDQFFAVAAQLQIEIGRDLILPGVITDSQLPAVYRCADAFVFPSTKEGWGLVILEAIASGLPVITSNQTPFTEFLTSNQALLVDPNSVAAIAEAMQAVIQPDLMPSLVQQSQSVLACYTWETSAKLHLHHYHQLLATDARNSLSNSMV